MFRQFAATSLLALILFMPSLGEATGERDRDVAEAVSRAHGGAVARVMPAVVSISAMGEDGEEFGSGLVVGRAGDVLTSLHVVSSASAIAVRLDDGTEYPAVLVARDAYADLALLRLGAPRGRVLQVASFGDENALRAGETLLDP